MFVWRRGYVCYVLLCDELLPLQPLQLKDAEVHAWSPGTPRWVRHDGSFKGGLFYFSTGSTAVPVSATDGRCLCARVISGNFLFHYHFGSEWRKQDGWQWWKRDTRCARGLSRQLHPCLRRLWCRVKAALVPEQSKTKCHFSQHY